MMKTKMKLQSSGEDTHAEEEEEVIKLQKERAETLRDEDFGLLNDEEDDSDEEPTLGEIMVKGKPKLKSSSDEEAENDAVLMYEEVEKDLSALSRDELMDAYIAYDDQQSRLNALEEANEKETSVRISLEKEISFQKLEISSTNSDVGSQNVDLDKEATHLRTCLSEREANWITLDSFLLKR